jgi:hypothetical protein
MHVPTGRLYDSEADARACGCKPSDLVTLSGDPDAIQEVSRKVKLATRVEFARAKARRKLQRASRRRNRR